MNTKWGWVWNISETTTTVLCTVHVYLSREYSVRVRLMYPVSLREAGIEIVSRIVSKTFYYVQIYTKQNTRL